MTLCHSENTSSKGGEKHGNGNQYFKLPDVSVPYRNSKYTVMAKHDIIGNTKEEMIT
jgi:hypothetical protein